MITLSLFYLKHSLGVEVDEVSIIRTSIRNKKIRESVGQLREFFKTNKEFNGIPVRFVPVKLNGEEIIDIVGEEESTVLFETVFNLIRDFKLRGYRIELVIAGGRKPMSIYPVVSAYMLFDTDDRIWHLLSSEEMVKSRALIPSDNDFYKLVPIPFIPWSTIAPVFYVDGLNPLDFIDEQRKKMMKEAKGQYLRFLGQLTYVEEKVLELMVKGYSNSQIAERLNKSIRTVEHQVQAIYGKFKVVFHLPIEHRLSRQRFITEILKFRYLYKIGNPAHDTEGIIV